MHFSLLDFTVILLASICLVRVHAQRTKRRYASLPPGPKKRFLIGNLKDMPTSYEHETYHKWGKEYSSDILHLDVAGTSLIILNLFDSALDLLDRRSAIYSGRPRFPMVRELMGWDFLLGLIPYGPDWRYHRRLFQQCFTPKAAVRFHPQEREAVHELLQRLLDRPDDLLAHLRHMAAREIITIAYGLEVLPEHDPYVAAAEEAAHSVSLAGNPTAFVVNMLPILKYVPELFPGAGFQRKAREWRALARRMIDMPFSAAMRNIEDGLFQPSFVSYNLHRSNQHRDAAYHRHAVKSMAGTMYTAGSDTTVTAIAAFVLGVLSNPEAQSKAHCEVDGLLQQGRLPDFIDEESLPYVTAIVKESLRWKTVTPLALPHLLEIDDVYREYRLPAGSIVIPDAWAMLHDETIYPDPFKLNPDRFMKDGHLDLDVKDPAVAAFGFGRRICPGRHMAYSSVWIAVASMLATFNITKAKDENGMVIEPSEGYATGLVSFPEPFRCSIKIRSKEAEVLIRNL